MAKSITVTDAYEDATGRYITVEVRDSAAPSIVIVRMPFQFDLSSTIAEDKLQIKATLAATLATPSAKTTLSALIGQVL